MPSSSLKIYYAKSSFQKKGAGLLFVAIILAIFLLPRISSWAYYEFDGPEFLQKVRQIAAFSSKPKPEIMEVYVSAYSSNEDETDDNPCIAASGYNLCQHNEENAVACNFLPFGSKIKFPDLDPDKTYIVVDRMNERFDSRVDIWKKTKAEARQFGLKYLKIEVYK